MVVGGLCKCFLENSAAWIGVGWLVNPGRRIQKTTAPVADFLGVQLLFVQVFGPNKSDCILEIVIKKCGAKDDLHSESLTVRKMVVGRRSFPIGFR